MAGRNFGRLTLSANLNRNGGINFGGWAKKKKKLAECIMADCIIQTFKYGFYRSTVSPKKNKPVLLQEKI